jgi:hypothetical protein
MNTEGWRYSDSEANSTCRRYRALVTPAFARLRRRGFKLFCSVLAFGGFLIMN